MSAAFDLLAYVQGPYARVDDERDDPALEVVGELPDALNGMFVQNSPNPRFAPTGFHHWFDGDGMVHGVHLRDGRASYTNRYVRTEGLAADEAAGRATSTGILMPFDPEAAQRDKDTANTDLVWFRGELLATWWLSGAPRGIEAPSLQTTGVQNFGGTLKSGLAAHPKVDPRTGELVFLDYDVYGGAAVRHGVVGADGRVAHVTELSTPGTSLYHDLAITEQYTIIPHFPMRFDPDKLRQGKRRIRWHAEEPARFGIVRRHGDEVRWFEAASCYCYHVVNAWEETDDRGHALVKLVACRIDDPVPSKAREDDPGVPRLFHLRLEPYLHEWTFDLTTGQTTERQLDDVPTEFPRMNDRVFGSKARFAYHPRVRRGDTLLFDGCIKYDLQAGTSTTWTWGEGLVGSETVFAPRPGATDEDDGWVMTFVTDLGGEASELQILDARDITAGPVARVKMKRRVPFGFHAEWAPGPFA